jgi:hypothetical protein
VAERLLQVVWVSLAAGVGVTTIFSLVIRWAARSTEERRGGRDRVAAGYVALSLVAFAVFLAGVVLGVEIMLSK